MNWIEKLQKFVPLVEQIGGRLEELTAHGFVKLETIQSCCTNHVFIAQEQGIVIKRPLICGHIGGEPPLTPSMAVPTIRIVSEVTRDYIYKNGFGIGSLQGYREVFIQPLVKTDNESQREAYHRLKEYAPSEVGIDLGYRNVGMLGDQPVVIDW